MPETHHAMTTNNHTILDQSPPRSTRTAPSAIHQDRGGQAWSLANPGGQWRTGKNGENWLQNHLWCSIDPRGKGIGDDDDDEFTTISFAMSQCMGAAMFDLG